MRFTILGAGAGHSLRPATVALVSLAALLAGCASKPSLQQSPAVKEQALNFTPPPGMSGVYVLRPWQFVDHTCQFKVSLDAQEFGVLSTETCAYGVVPPGNYAVLVEVLASGGARPRTEHFHAEAGRNYYLQTKMGWTGTDVTQLSEAEGQNCVKKFKLVGWSPESATSMGMWEVFKAEVARGANADFQDEKGLTPLFFAARQGNKDATEFLLAHGANVNHKSKAGETPLMWAASGPGNTRLLSNHSVDSALACSASGMGDNLPVAIRLVQAGADVNARTQRGLTAMGIAAMWGSSSIALWLYDQGADADIPEKECEVSGRLAHVLGDYFLAQDKVEPARASFEKAQRGYRATVKAVKGQVASRELVQTLFGLAQFGLAAAAQQQAQIQAHQMAQIAALSRAARSGGGVTAYSTYLQKYDKVYVPTYNGCYTAPPDPTSDIMTYYNAKIKYYDDMEKFMSRVLACFANYADMAELHGRIENLSGQSRSPYAFAIACVQEIARNYAAKSGDTNVVISPMELPDKVYGKQVESEIRFGESALWRLTIMSGWTPATQAKKGYDLNSPFLRITFMDAQKKQTGEIYFRMNQVGDKMTIVYATNLADPQPATIDGEFDLSSYESRIRDTLQRITDVQLRLVR